MKQLEYRIATLTPLLISQSSGDPNMVATKEYIPGSIILGLAAGLYIKKNKLDKNAHENRDFHNLFLSDEVSFGNAYIMTKTYSNNWERNCPLPISVQCEKNDENSITDLLFGAPTEQTKVVGGYGQLSSGEDHDYLYRQAISKSLNFHHTKDRKNGNITDIFNYESIDAGQMFAGVITGDEELLNEIKRVLSSEEHMNIGRSRHAQYGQITIKLEDMADYEGEIKLDYDDLDGEISLTLLSPAILYNKQGFSEVSENLLEETLNSILGIDCKIKKSFLRSIEIENYVSVWNMPRPSETAFAAGSCFLLAGKFNDLKDKLIELHVSGIGERRNEGFGRIVLSWQRKDRLIVIEQNKSPNPIELISFPELTNKIIKKILDDEWLRYWENKAIQDAGEFDNLPSKSLVSRLEALATQMPLNEFVSVLGNERTTSAANETRKRIPEKTLTKIRDCTKSDITLLDYILKQPDQIKNQCKSETSGKIKSLIEMSNKVSGHQIALPDTDSLTKLFYRTFFAALRKKCKADKQEYGQ